MAAAASFDSAQGRIHLSSLSHSDGTALVITKQPNEVFFKDHGGKHALLSATVRSPVPLTAPLPLACRLLLENGTFIDDQRSVLELPHLGHSDMLALGPSAQEVTIEFRILKVSRNFDNARFVLEVAPDYSALTSSSSGSVDRVAGVRTFPILVKSKRRRSERRAGPSTVDTDDTHRIDSSSHDGETPGETTNALLRELIAEQRRTAGMLQSVVATQNVLLGGMRSLVASMFPPKAQQGPEGVTNVMGPREPPTPSLFRREGTDSSIGSTGTDGSDLSFSSIPYFAPSSSLMMTHGVAPASSIDQLAAVAEAESRSKRVCHRFGFE
jgi:hypothetical protein